MAPKDCIERYPDIYEPTPHVTQKDEAGKRLVDDINAKNERRKKLYLAVRFLLRQNFSFDPDDSTTTDPAQFPGGFGKKSHGESAKVYEGLLLDEKVLFLSVFGVLLSRNYEDPSFGRAERGTAGPDDIWVPESEKPAHSKHDFNVLIVDRFIEATTDAVKVFNANRDLFREVFRVLLEEGSRDNADGQMVVTVYARQLAEVTRRLVDDHVDPKAPQIKRIVVNALSTAIGGDFNARPADVDLDDLPDLEAGTAVDIVPENVMAVATIYFSAMLEEMKLYATMEKVAEHFVSGALPIQRGQAGERLFEWIRTAPQRFTEVERRSVYGRVLGLAQGVATEVMPNREFSDLWVRLLSTVSLFQREKVATTVKKVYFEQIHKSARDLAVNLSLHGYGLPHFFAVEARGLIRQMKETLSRQELLTAYGVNDVWQLVDRVSGLYLGGSVNGVRYRTMASAGGIIIQWLARNAPILSSAATLHSEDFVTDDLVFNVQRWLAVTGTPDESVEKFTDPVDLKQQLTVPMMPASGAAAQTVRSALERAGLGSMPIAVQ